MVDMKDLNELHILAVQDGKIYPKKRFLYYLKSTRGKKTPNYMVSYDKEKCIIEIGGKGKGIQQFKGFTGGTKIVFSDSAIFKPNQRPLFLLGFLV